METPAVVRVDVPGRPYDVVVGAGLLPDLGRLVADALAARPATGFAVVAGHEVDARYGDAVARALDVVAPVQRIVVDDGEDAKTVATLNGVWAGLAAGRLDRSGVVVALGGGVVGDLAGFAAATWNRGVRVVQVPTTLLAQVDAAVGGKTGVNLPQGKNLVGAFHQPLLVVADVATLATLPAREIRAGLGEVVKYGWIADAGLLDLLERARDVVLAADPGTLVEVVRRSVAVKADVVAGDEREAGRRMLLNYGHTIGHAVETLTGYVRYRHGEAVGLGMVAEASIGEAVDVSEPGTAERTAALLAHLRLPTAGAQVAADDVWAAIALDKKTSAGRVRMVACPRPGAATVIEAPPRDAVDAAVERIR